MSVVLEDIERQLVVDIEWRCVEIDILRKTLRYGVDEDKPKRNIMMRSGWAMTYAHYEGFCKFALELYIDFLAKEMSPEFLSNEMACFFYEAKINVFRNKKSLDLLKLSSALNSDIRKNKIEAKEFDTKSNLWPNIIEEISDKLGLDHSRYLTHKLELQKLVGTRNDIAHGKNVPVGDFWQLDKCILATIDTMDNLALSIVDSCGSIKSGSYSAYCI